MEQTDSTPDKEIYNPGELINETPLQVRTPDSGVQTNNGLGKALIGRDVRKTFGSKKYFGKVIEFNEITNWYTVAYQDGDKEDLLWPELVDLVLPIDMNAPLQQPDTKTDLLDFGLSEFLENSSKRGRGRPKGSKNKIKSVKTDAEKSAPKTPAPQGSITGRKRGRPRKTPGTDTAAPAKIQKKTASSSAKGTAPQVSASGKKRGRPRKYPIVERIPEAATADSNSVAGQENNETGHQAVTNNASADTTSIDPNASGMQSDNPSGTEVIPATEAGPSGTDVIPATEAGPSGTDVIPATEAGPSGTDVIPATKAGEDLLPGNTSANSAAVAGFHGDA